jgi:hypothetical protein
MYRARSEADPGSIVSGQPSLPLRACGTDIKSPAGQAHGQRQRAEPVWANTSRPIWSRSTAGGHLLPRTEHTRVETLTGAGRSKGSPRAVAGHRRGVGADAEVSGVPREVLERLQADGAVGSIRDGSYRDEIMVAAPRSSVKMQEHD